jgi:hypothetical protein
MDFPLSYAAAIVLCKVLYTFSRKHGIVVKFIASFFHFIGLKLHFESIPKQFRFYIAAIAQHSFTTKSLLTGHKLVLRKWNIFNALVCKFNF